MLTKSSDRQKFEPIRQSEDCESSSFLSESNENVKIPTTRPFPKILFIIFLLATFFLSAFAGALLGKNFGRDPDAFCMARTSQPSPLLKDLDIKYHVSQFNGSFLQEEIFRREASPEVDEAWQSLGVDYRSIVIPSDQAALSGFAEDHIQIRPEYGGGYPANVEGLHHLHCLNLLRQGLYYNYEYYLEKQQGAFLNEEPILRLHITHCLDILRQQLMCTVDVGVLGRVWWNKKDPTAFPDFNTKHKCRNFEDVRRWAFEHQAPERVPEDYLVPPRHLSIVSEGMP